MNEVLRQEKKFLISLDQYYELSHKVSQVMHGDEHNQGKVIIFVPFILIRFMKRIMSKRKMVWN